MVWFRKKGGNSVVWFPIHEDERMYENGEKL